MTATARAGTAAHTTRTSPTAAADKPQPTAPKPKSRTRRSARNAGARFERLLADHLNTHIDDRIDRRVKTGAKDRGDIANLRSAHNLRIVVEAKDCARTDLAGWRHEAETEAGNDDAPIALVAHKRRGHAQPGAQWITMTVDDLVALITGKATNEATS